MSISCMDLLHLKHFNKIKLVAGENGLQRNVTWPYVGQTLSVANWVHGGELLFITGVSHSASNLKDILQECIVKGLAGLVVLVGTDYIKAIPPELIEQANVAAFPLFEMPWNVKLIDVTREITDVIMFDSFEKKRAKSFLGRLLFAPEVDYDNLAEQAEINEIKLLPYGFIAIFNVTSQQQVDMLQQDSLEDKLQHAIKKLCAGNKINLVSLVSANNIICLISATTAEQAAAAVKYLKTAHPLFLQIHNESDLYLSFGRIYEKLQDFKQSYIEALRALSLCKKMQRQNHIATYAELGIYRLLFKIEDTEEIKQFYHYNLDPLINFDLQNKAELLPTLKQYFYCNSNLVKTSQALFIHPNTLLYRLNQIRDLLGKDLDDATVKLDLFNSIVAKDYLGE
ncbi:MAG: PucR family transcriptional regulator ligand-binding domain-containing protein [Acidaminococcaceae bacterium]